MILSINYSLCEAYYYETFLVWTTLNIKYYTYESFSHKKKIIFIFL